MKKTRFIVLALAVAVMLMGAGYAAWTDQLNITDTINTGHLDVYFVDLQGDELKLAPHETGSVSYSQDGEGGQNDWDTATAMVNNVYPGGNFDIKYRMKNNSTMPVKLKDIGLSGWDAWTAAAGGVPGDGGICSRITFFNPDGTTITATNAHPWNPDVFTKVIVPVDGYLDILVEFAAGDGYAEDTTYTATMTPIFGQYNK